VVSSLWKVDDEGTSILMSGFYDNFFSGLFVRDALHRARVDFLSENRAAGGDGDPLEWGAFVVAE